MKETPTTWCEACGSWRHTPNCGRDDCPGEKGAAMNDSSADRIARLRELADGLDDEEFVKWPELAVLLRDSADALARLQQERNGLKAAYELEQREANEFSQELTELQATVDRLTAALRETAADWKRSAEDLHRGQQTRQKMGHEVLANCAYALEDILAAPAPADPEGRS